MHRIPAMLRSPRRRWIALALVLLAGCSSLPKDFQKPEVALQSLDIDKATLTDATILVKLAVKNPNDYGIDVDAMRYILTVNGKPLAEGRLLEEAKVTANGESVISVPVRMKYWDLFNRFSEMVKGKKSSYEVKGSLTSDNREIPFERKGEFELPSPRTDSAS
jgi:LEA14-like dessication related protein